MVKYPAHIRKDGTVQTVEEHLKNVSEYCKYNLSKIGLKNTGMLLGIIHDIGKFTPDFKDYIEKSTAGIKTVKGNVNHTFSGVKFIMEFFNEENVNEYFWRNFTCEILSYVSGSHHGMVDCYNNEGKNGIEHRLQKDGINYGIARSCFIERVMDKENFTFLLNKSENEIHNIVSKLSELGERDAEGVETYFYIGLFYRLLLSALVDADRTDTSLFMNRNIHNEKHDENIFQLIQENFNNKYLLLKQETEIEKTRKYMSDVCFENAKLKPNLYGMSIPTGGGKTLTSIRYAIEHAKIYNKDRIIFTTPLLSILDQNAKIIKSYIGNDSMVIEHHSNVVNDFGTEEELKEYELLCETWNCPIVITTQVRLLDTLFSGKMTDVRRFRALCNSIIVMDEVQTIPKKMLSLFNLAINFLSEICNTTVVFCSATQPCFENVTHGLLREPKQLVNINNDITNTFKRTNIISKEQMNFSDALLFSSDICRKSLSVLIICNTKAEAKKFYKYLEDYVNEEEIFYISSSLCVEHRRKVISDMTKRLQENKKVICISTQVIEAGVDISFETVIRLSAGLDNVIQAAGRCNRNGENKKYGNVYVIPIVDEKLNNLDEILWGKQVIMELLLLNYNLEDSKTINEYYKKFLSNSNMARNYKDYYVKEQDCTLLDLFSINYKFADSNSECINKYQMRQSFRLAGNIFKVFDNDGIDILIPYGNGKRIILELQSDKAHFDLSYRKNLLKEASLYSVHVYENQYEKLKEFHAIQNIDDYIFFLQENYYDSVFGLVVEEKHNEYLEV